MRYTLDTEFDGHNGPLISLALVREDWRSLYYFNTWVIPEDPWVRENVIPILLNVPDHVDKRHMDRGADAGTLIRRFIGDDQHPIIIADSPVDIGRFCQVLSTGPRNEWVSTKYPRMSFEVHNVDCWPNDLPATAVQHNAYWDARALWEKI